MTATAEEPRAAADAPLTEPSADDHTASDPDESHVVDAAAWWVKPVARSLAVFAVSRVVALSAMIMGNTIPGGRPLKVAFYYWDAGWWIGAIKHGYPRHIAEEGGRAIQSTIAFFPGYPLLARGVRVFGFTNLEAAIIVATAAGAVSAVLLWFFARRLAGPEVADRAVALFCFFPSSFVMLAPYSDGVMIAFTLGSMITALRRQWLWAGLLAAAASATRPTAIMLTPALGVAALLAIRDRREWSALVAPALAPFGMIGYFLFLRHHTGDLGAWFRVQAEGWGYSKPDWGMRAFRYSRDLLFTNPLVDVNVITGTLAAVFILVALYFVIRWRPPAFVWIFTALVSFQIVTGGLPSRPRYILNAFPLIIAVAWRVRSAWAYSMVLAGSACLLGVYTLMSTSTTLSIP